MWSMRHRALSTGSNVSDDSDDTISFESTEQQISHFLLHLLNSVFEIGYQKANEIVLLFEEQISKNDLEKDPAYAYYLGRIKWAVGDTVSAKKYFNYVLKPSDSNTGGKREQQELIKFLAKHNIQ